MSLASGRKTGYRDNWRFTAFGTDFAEDTYEKNFAGISALAPWIRSIESSSRTTRRSKGKNVGILWETSCNNVGNSEQNEQMKKRPSVRANHV
jgi:hypothetical protein